jgi:hypothetical protein
MSRSESLTHQHRDPEITACFGLSKSMACGNRGNRSNWSQFPKRCNSAPQIEWIGP